MKTFQDKCLCVSEEERLVEGARCVLGRGLLNRKERQCPAEHLGDLTDVAGGLLKAFSAGSFEQSTLGTFQILTAGQT